MRSQQIDPNVATAIDTLTGAQVVITLDRAHVSASPQMTTRAV